MLLCALVLLWLYFREWRRERQRGAFRNFLHSATEKSELNGTCFESNFKLKAFACGRLRCSSPKLKVLNRALKHFQSEAHTHAIVLTELKYNERKLRNIFELAWNLQLLIRWKPLRNRIKNLPQNSSEELFFNFLKIKYESCCEIENESSIVGRNHQGLQT